jgi:hypothetical protein
MNRARRLITVSEDRLSRVSGLVSEYDFYKGSSVYADSALTTFASVAGVIGGVKDVSGSGVNIPGIQTTTSAKPTLTANAINGRQAASFDGGDLLTVDSLAAYFNTNDGPYSCVTVFNRPANVSPHDFFAIGKSTVNTPYILHRVTGNTAYSIRRNDGSLSPQVDAGTPTAVPHILFYLFSGTTVTIMLDGTIIANEAALNANAIASMDTATIGALRRTAVTSYFIGYIGQLAVWPTRIATPEALWGTRLLGRKWGIATA